MSIEDQGHFFTIYFPGFVCFVLYSAKISGERLQDHWSSGFYIESEVIPLQLFCNLIAKDLLTKYGDGAFYVDSKVISL